MIRRTSHTARARTIVIALAAVVAALSLAACFDVSGPSGRDGTSTRTGGSNGAALVGQWLHTVVFTADDGSLHSSETLWSFRNDFLAQRSVIAANLTTSTADTVVADALWEATATTVTITFQPPDSGSVTFNYSVRADTLTLDSQDFIRVN